MAGQRRTLPAGDGAGGNRKQDDMIHKMPEKNQRPSRKKSPPAEAVEVEFVFERCGVEQVYICGQFNDWQPASLRMIGAPEAGLWEKRLVLPPGRYEYKFVVDGSWLHDPDAPENVPNVFGSLNSVVEVRSDRQTHPISRPPEVGRVIQTASPHK